MNIPGYTFNPEQDLIGRGGMASVYRARQHGLEREVALKILTPDQVPDPSLAARFLREARIQAQLSHPNIVAVHEVGIHEDTPFLSMDFVEGGDLTERTSAGISTNLAVDWCRQIASALAYIHEKGYVHRDIKPANVLFRSDGTLVLGDFGIAKSENDDTQLTNTGVLVGTPSYLSPEQIRGEELDGRSDLYSLGILLFKMLTGIPPFEGSTQNVLQQQLTHPLPELPPQKHTLQWIVTRLTAKNRRDRFQSAEELIGALQDFDSQANAQTQRVVPQHGGEDRKENRSAWLGLPRFDTNREARFQLEHTQSSVQLLRITIPLGIFVYLTFFLWDFAQPGYDPLITFSIRFSYCVYLAALVGLSFTDFFQRNAQPIVVVSMFFAFAGVAFILFLLPDGFLYGYGGLCLALMYGCTLTSMQFRPALVFVAVSLALSNGLIAIDEHSRSLSYVLVNTNFFLVSVAAAGLVAAFVLEYSQRLRFAETGTIGTSWVCNHPQI